MCVKKKTCFSCLLIIFFTIQVGWTNGLPTFKDITKDCGIKVASNDIDWLAGVYCADLDNDGDLDIIIGSRKSWNPLHRCRIFRNDRNGEFVDITKVSGIAQHDLLSVRSICIVDLTGDGLLDISVANEQGIHIFKNNGNNSFTYLRTNPKILAEDVIYGDLDGDEDLDMYVAEIFGDGFALKKIGQFIYQQIPNTRYPCIKSQLFKDINGDNLLDILLFQSYPEKKISQATFLLNQGGGKFMNFTMESGIDAEGYTSNLGDIDNDGDLDLLVCYPNLRLYENDGKGHFKDITDNSGLLENISLNQPIFLDINNDELLDILIGNKLYQGLGGRKFKDISNNLNISGTYYTAGDIDNDGDLDIFSLKGDNGTTQIRIWQNNLNNEDWLKIDLIGSSPNISSIGAKIWVYVHGYLGDKRYIRGYREVGVGKGISTLQQHFGVDSSKTYDIRVRFPTGKYVELIDIQPPVHLKIAEDTSISIKGK